MTQRKRNLTQTFRIVAFGTPDGGPLKQEKFPFEILAQYNTLSSAVNDGWQLSQIWSVTEADGDVWTYGPSRHYVNLLHYVCTEEHHNDDSYVEVSFDIERMSDD
tara:strand:- start:737 stop:1051 length:315 start_codon:yes stop_codon:yes gene_type:complete